MADSPTGPARIYAARFNNRADADAVRTKVESFGYDPAELSYISDCEKCSFTLDAAGSHVARAGTTGIVGGALFGGGVGTAVGALGFGSLVVLGPVGAAIGIGAGGVIGLLLGFGVDSDVATACEEAIKAGSLVMTVQAHAGDDDRIVAALADHVIGTEDDVYLYNSP
jgi:uncharacterized membrane protein